MKTDKQIQNLVDNFGDWVQSKEDNKKMCTARMTKELYPYSSIFSPIRINSVTVKNRVVMGPMGNIMMCEETGRPNEKMLQYFFARAKGGVGLITTGLVPVSHKIDHSVDELHNKSMFPVLDNTRTTYMGWRDLAQGCHAYGSKVFIQLTPGLGRVGPTSCLLNAHKFPRSSSFNPNFYTPEVPCMRLSDLNLTRIVKRMGQASADAKVNGLDGVYLHGHEGYLLEQMTNKAFNHRKLSKYANWQKFGIDCVKEMRKRVGAGYPIMYRIDLSLALNETYGKTMNKVNSLKKFKNGRSIAETLEYMENLVKAGVDMFDVDLGCYDNWWLPHPPASMPAGCFLDISKIAKEHFANKNIKSNAGLEVPIVAVGKLGYPDLAEKAIREGDCDMVMLARPLLADAEWCNKAYAGKVEDICPCIGCQEGCVNEFVEGGHPQCAINPRTGFEEKFPVDLPKADVKKKICVVGAGPAGITFAVNAAKRGHNVELFEKADKIGGKVLPGAAPKIKFDFDNYLKWLENEVAKAEKMDNFKITYNFEVSNEWLIEQKYDSVVYAYGVPYSTPPFKGLDTMKTVQATDLLVNPSLMGDAQKICVVGGGVVGCETAYWLAYEYGKDVEVVEMMKHFMGGTCTANRGHLIHYMEKAGVKLHNGAMLTEFKDGKVVVKQSTSKKLPNPYNTWQPILPPNIKNPLEPAAEWAPFARGNKDNKYYSKLDKKFRLDSIDADLVVLALGGRADEKMFFDAQANNIAPEIYNIGDSQKLGRALEATRAAFNLASRI